MLHDTDGLVHGILERKWPDVMAVTRLLHMQSKQSCKMWDLDQLLRSKPGIAFPVRCLDTFTHDQSGHHKNPYTSPEFEKVPVTPRFFYPRFCKPSRHLPPSSPSTPRLIASKEYRWPSFLHHQASRPFRPLAITDHHRLRHPPPRNLS
jgi:hypothetical protein